MALPSNQDGVPSAFGVLSPDVTTGPAVWQMFEGPPGFAPKIAAQNSLLPMAVLIDGSQ